MSRHVWSAVLVGLACSWSVYILYKLLGPGQEEGWQIKEKPNLILDVNAQVLLGHYETFKQ